MFKRITVPLDSTNVVEHALDGDFYGPFDPELQWPQYFKERPKCDCCDSNEDVQRCRYSRSIMPVFLTGGKIGYVKEMQYYCRKPSCRSKPFSVLDERVVETFPAALKRQIQFTRISNRVSCGDSLLSLIVELKAKGQGFKTIQDVFRANSETEMYKREIRYQYHIDTLKDIHCSSDKKTARRSCPGAFSK